MRGKWGKGTGGGQIDLPLPPQKKLSLKSPALLGLKKDSFTNSSKSLGIFSCDSMENLRSNWSSTLTCLALSLTDGDF